MDEPKQSLHSDPAVKRSFIESVRAKWLGVNGGSLSQVTQLIRMNGFRLEALDASCRAKHLLQQEFAFAAGEIFKDSIPQKMGLKAEDLVLNINGEIPASEAELRKLFLRVYQEGQARVEVIREGRRGLLVYSR